MANGDNSAHAGRNGGHLLGRAPLAEFFKAPKLRHVERGSADLACIIELQRNFGVSFNAGDWIYDNSLHHVYRLLSKLKFSGQIGKPPGQKFRQDKMVEAD